jgi:hypothetical protein
LIFLWIVGCFESVSLIFCLKLLLILNLTNSVLSKTTFGSIFVSPDGVLCTKEIHKSKKPATVTRQLTKSLDFHQNCLCDFHLSACRNLPLTYCNVQYVSKAPNFEMINVMNMLLYSIALTST